MTAFALAAAALHADAHLAQAATYTPPGANPAPVACRVILAEREDGAELGGIVRETVATLRLAEVPAPVEGATLAVGGVTWRVRNVARDIEGVTATLALRSA